MFFFLLLPLLESAFEYATLSLIITLLLLSLLSLCFVFQLRFKSRTLYHLQDFNSLWSVRFSLVSLITLWALNELVRIPFFRLHLLYSLFPSPTLSDQAHLCKIQAVLSLGFLEPAFLVTLLFLLNVSIKKKTPCGMWAIPFALFTCLPVLMLQIMCVFVVPLNTELPVFFTRSSVLSKNVFGDRSAVLCAYPLLSTIVFGAFGIGYSICFFFSCGKVVSLVINKGLRVRTYGLAFTVLVALPMQIAGLGLSVLWRPEESAYSGVALVAFIGTFLCAAVGEGILIIKPITDAMAAGGHCCRWNPVAVQPGRGVSFRR